MSISPFVSKKQYNDDFNKIKSNIEKIQKIDETSQSIEEDLKKYTNLLIMEKTFMIKLNMIQINSPRMLNP